MKLSRLYPDARPTSLRRYSSAALRLKLLSRSWLRSGSAMAAAPAQAGYRGELAALGVPEALLDRLDAFLAVRHPGRADSVYHGLRHSVEVANLTGRVLRRVDRLTPGRKILLILAAALHDVDPSRPHETPPLVAGTLEHLSTDHEARRLLEDFGDFGGFTPEQVHALIMATDFDDDRLERDAKWARFVRAAESSFEGAPWVFEWGRALSFFDRVATYIVTSDHAIGRVRGLAHELRRRRDGDGPSDADMLEGTREFLASLRREPAFTLLSPEDRSRFESVAAHPFFNPVRYRGLALRLAACAALVAAACGAAGATSLEIKEVGAGVVLGEPLGATAKFWLDDHLAFDAGAGISDGNAAFWADALWHEWSLFPQPAQGRLGGYIGVGPQIRTGDEARFGFRTVVGATFRPTGRPLEFFAEVGPMFRLTQGGTVDPVGGVGVRLMLGSSR